MCICRTLTGKQCATVQATRILAALLYGLARGNGMAEEDTLRAGSSLCGSGTARAGLQGRACSHLEVCERRPSPTPRPLVDRRSPRCAWPGATVTVCAS